MRHDRPPVEFHTLRPSHFRSLRRIFNPLLGRSPSLHALSQLLIIGPTVTGRDGSSFGEAEFVHPRRVGNRHARKLSAPRRPPRGRRRGEPGREVVAAAAARSQDRDAIGRPAACRVETSVSADARGEHARPSFASRRPTPRRPGTRRPAHRRTLVPPRKDPPRPRATPRAGGFPRRARAGSSRRHPARGPDPGRCRARIGDRGWRSGASASRAVDGRRPRVLRFPGPPATARAGGAASPRMSRGSGPTCRRGPGGTARGSRRRAGTAWSPSSPAGEEGSNAADGRRLLGRSVAAGDRVLAGDPRDDDQDGDRVEGAVIQRHEVGDLDLAQSGPGC